MNVLIIARGIPDQKSLLGIFEYDQARALAAAGHRVVLFAIDLRSIRRTRRYGVHSGKSDGIFWYRIDIPVGAVPMGILCRIGQWAVCYLYQIVFGGRKRPDIIHAHFTEQGCMAVALAEKEQIPLVITEHSTDMVEKKISGKLRKYAGKSYAAAEKVIAVSSCLACKMEQRTGKCCEVIPNIVSNDVLKQSNIIKTGIQNKKRMIQDCFGFVMTGSLIDRKCPQLLLEAFACLYKKYPDICLGFIGSGEKKKELETYVKRMGLEKAVRFYGVLSRTEIAKVYQEYDCFVLPSELETFGVVYIEAMAAGLPVIATRCGGPEDFVTDETGYLIAVNQKQELINAMEKMYHRRGEFQEETIQKYAKEHFSEEAVAARLTDVYRQVLKQYRSV